MSTVPLIIIICGLAVSWTNSPLRAFSEGVGYTLKEAAMIKSNLKGSSIINY